MSISARKNVSLNLSLMGCFGPNDSTSYTHSVRSMLSSTLTDRSFLPQEVYLVSRTVFLTFFYGLLMLSLSLPQLDASRSGKWMPTTVRQFLFAPVILLSLASPRTFSYPHLPLRDPKRDPRRDPNFSKSPVLGPFSDIFSETSVYVQILELFLKNFK